MRAAVEKAPLYRTVRLDHTVSKSRQPPLEPSGVSGDDAPSEQVVWAALAGVVDPELGANIVELGMVREGEVQGGAVSVAVALTVAACPLRDQLRADVERRLKAVPGVELVDVSTGVMDPSERSALMARARLKAQDRAVPTDIPATARVLAVASGKGGVGKTSIA